MDSTIRYLGVELEDALAIAEAIEIKWNRAVVADGPEPAYNSDHRCRGAAP